ncbi:MAG: hypothetical protein QXU06_03880 [Candidatus Bathyarchaeia archaeon]
MGVLSSRGNAKRVVLGGADFTFEDPSLIVRASYPEASKPSPRPIRTDPPLRAALVDEAHASYPMDLERERFHIAIASATPRRRWHRAARGTADEFAGAIARAFPELQTLTEEDIEEAIRRVRGKG